MYSRALFGSQPSPSPAKARAVPASMASVEESPLVPTPAAKKKQVRSSSLTLFSFLLFSLSHLSRVSHSLFSYNLFYLLSLFLTLVRSTLSISIFSFLTILRSSLSLSIALLISFSLSLSLAANQEGWGIQVQGSAEDSFRIPGHRLQRCCYH